MCVCKHKYVQLYLEEYVVVFVFSYNSISLAILMNVSFAQSPVSKNIYIYFFFAQFSVFTCCISLCLVYMFMVHTEWVLKLVGFSFIHFNNPFFSEFHW
jgi:hypothetical protein